MDFSQVYQHSTNIKYSPSGQYFATSIQNRLVIKDSDNLDPISLFECSDTINFYEWSPDSDMILIGNYKLGVIQIWSISDENWSATISQGSDGLQTAIWAPDSRNILIFAENNIHITIFSLSNTDKKYILNPKYSTKGYFFTPDFFCCLCRVDSDYLCLFDLDFTLVNSVKLDSQDIFDISCSPDNKFIACWDSVLQYNLYIYRIDGRLVSKYSQECYLGVKTVVWSPSSKFLSIGSFDQTVFN
jgi:WD40 repeat protein